MNAIRTVDKGIRTVNSITDKEDDYSEDIAQIPRNTAVTSYKFIRKVGKSAVKLHSSFSHVNSDIRENPAKKKFVADYAKKAYKRMEKVVRRMKNFLVSSVKAALSGTKMMLTFLLTGGTVAVMLIVLVSLVSLVAGSSYGIFFAGEDTGGLSIRSVITELNGEYEARIENPIR